MKIFDALHDFFAPQEEDSYETEPVRETREARERREVRESFRERETIREPEESSAREVRQPASLRDSYRPESEYPTKRDNKVVNIQATAQLQVVLVKPEVFTDAKQIADHLISKQTVVLNLETASAEKTHGHCTHDHRSSGRECGDDAADRRVHWQEWRAGD